MKLRECLEKCDTMWMWISKRRPSCISKNLYFEKHPRLKKPEFLCYCCSFVGRKSGDVGRWNDFCWKCPLVELWTGVPAPTTKPNSEQCGTFYYVPCEKNINSPYAKWRASRFQDTKAGRKHAREIALFCREKLRLMDKKKGK